MSGNFAWGAKKTCTPGGGGVGGSMSIFAVSLGQTHILECIWRARFTRFDLRYLPKFIRGCCVKTGIKTWYMKYSVKKSHSIWVSRVKFYKTKGSRFQDFRTYVHKEAGDQIWAWKEMFSWHFFFKTNQHLRLFFKAQFNNCVKTVFLKISSPMQPGMPFLLCFIIF